jgi:AcrR family transcriptional regulator
VRDIARAAGVSAQTVYDSVGTKQQLVARLNDLVDAEAGIAAIVQTARNSEDPAEVAATQARITRSILTHCGDIIRALAGGAAAEPALAAVLEEGHRRHVAGAREIVKLLRRLDAPLAAGPDEVADALAALSDFRFALVLHESYGWPLDRIEDWIAAMSRTAVLGPPRS